MRTRASTRALAAGGAVAVVASLILVALVATGFLGVVTTSGESMEPRYSDGDLVLVARRSAYEVGDVVAYRSETLGANVLHRIVAREGGRSTLQGDHNSWTDEDHPLDSEVLGAELLHVPGAGRVLALLRRPLIAGSLLLVFGAVGGETLRRNRRPARTARPLRTARASASAHGYRPGPARAARWLTWGSAGVAAIAVVACVVAVSGARPSSSTVDQPFVHRGELAYRGAASGGLVYSQDEITTGDPVFLNLTDRVELTYAYSLDPGALESVRGTVDLHLLAEAGNGWSRELELLADVPLTGHDVRLDLPLRLDQLRSLFDAVEEESGVSMGSYLLTLTPKVSLDAVAGGKGVTAVFAPSYEFQMDRQQFRPTATEELTGRGPVLVASESGSTQRSVRGADTVTVFGYEVPAVPTRNVAAAVTLLAAASAAAARVWRRRVAPRNEADRLAERLGYRVVEVDRGETDSSSTVVDVTSVSALVRIAEHHDALVLRHRQAHLHTFMVEVDSTLYRHVIDDRMPPAPVVPLDARRASSVAAQPTGSAAELRTLRTPLL